jgi:hypothetical protein
VLPVVVIYGMVMLPGVKVVNFSLRVTGRPSPFAAVAVIVYVLPYPRTSVADQESRSGAIAPETAFPSGFTSLTDVNSPSSADTLTGAVGLTACDPPAGLNCTSAGAAAAEEVAAGEDDSELELVGLAVAD